MIQSLLSWFLLLVWLIPILLYKSTAQPFILFTGSLSHLSLPDLYKPHISLAQPITSSQASLGGSNLKSEALLGFLPCPRLFSSPLLMSPCNNTQTCHHILLNAAKILGCNRSPGGFPLPLQCFFPDICLCQLVPHASIGLTWHSALQATSSLDL